MAGLSNYLAQALLNHIVGKTAYTMPTPYIGLFTAVGTDAGTGFTEVSGGGYARQAASGAVWNASSGSDPSTITNASVITFPTSTAAWGTILAFGLFDAASAGNLLDWDFLGNDPWFPFTCTAASPGVLTAIGISAGSSPALANGALVTVDSEWGGALPTGLTQYGAYTVASLSADTFNVGTNTTTTGSGMVRQYTPQVVASNVTLSFAASTLTLTLS